MEEKRTVTLHNIDGKPAYDLQSFTDDDGFVQVKVVNKRVWQKPVLLSELLQGVAALAPDAVRLDLDAVSVEIHGDVEGPLDELAAEANGDR